jgi:hypothetical protein
MVFCRGTMSPPTEADLAIPESTGKELSGFTPLSVDHELVQESGRSGGAQLPKTPEELRQILQLPEVQVPITLYEEKRLEVEGYVHQRTLTTPRNQSAQGPVNLDYEEKKIAEHKADQKLSTKIWRGVLKRRLQFSGIKDAEAVIAAMEDSVVIDHINDLQPKAVAKLFKKIDAENDQEAVRKFKMASDRLKQFYMVPSSREVSTETDHLADLISTIAEYPEDKWQEFYHQFDGRTQLIHHQTRPIFNPGFLQVVKQGKLTDTQIKTLDMAASWHEFAQALPFSNKPDEQYCYWLRYDQLFDPKIPEKLAQHYPYLIDWATTTVLPYRQAKDKAAQYGSYLSRDEEPYGRDFILGLNHLESSGGITYLQSLINQGWNTKGIYQEMKDLDLLHKDPQNIDHLLHQAITFSADVDKMAWTKVFKQGVKDTTPLSVDQIPLYESLLNNKELMIPYLIFINTLPKEQYHPLDYLKVNNGEVTIDERLLTRVFFLVNDRELSENEKMYAEVLQFLAVSQDPAKGVDLPEKMLPLYAYLALNRDRLIPPLREGWRKGEFTAHIIQELIEKAHLDDRKIIGRLLRDCSNQSELPLELQLEYYEILKPETMRALFSEGSEERLAKYPPDLQTLSAYFKTLPPESQQKMPNLAKEFIPVLLKDITNPETTLFWNYYFQNPILQLDTFLYKQKDAFSLMIVDGKETDYFYQVLLANNPSFMFGMPGIKPGLSARQYQDMWRRAIGAEVFDPFLQALPKLTDEERNAFSGNDYDRTTKFVEFMYQFTEFNPNAEELTIMTDYINQFGLSKNAQIYGIYRQLYRFEHQLIAELPSELKELGVTTSLEMVKKVNEVRKLVYAATSLNTPQEMRNLTPFQIQILASVTGFDSARFGAGDSQRLKVLIDNFANDLENNRIASLPKEYKPEVIDIATVKVEFNPEAVAKEYQLLKSEILACINNPTSVDGFKSQSQAVLDRRIALISDRLTSVTDQRAIEGMQRNLKSFHEIRSQIESAESLDKVTLALLSGNFPQEDRLGNEEFVGIDTIMRQIILTKLYQKGDRSSVFIENTRAILSKDEITSQGINEIVLVVDEMIKNHVLSLDYQNKEGYWQNEVFETINASESLRRNFRRIPERFNPYAEKLRQEQANFVKVETGQVSQVTIIPDRGLIGELAGYLADVCYVRVPELLKKYSGQSPEKPLVIPYKFVVKDSAAGDDPAFLGSVLVFETQTAAGENSLLVRALDIPNEDEVDIPTFSEKLLDTFAGVGKQRGKTKVQLAGTRSTISNYTNTTSYILDTYVQGKTPDPVSPRFDFNHYDITNDIYTARIIT